MKARSATAARVAMRTAAATRGDSDSDIRIRMRKEREGEGEKADATRRDWIAIVIAIGFARRRDEVMS